jgi:hypothetical protein
MNESMRKFNGMKNANGRRKKREKKILLQEARAQNRKKMKGK